MSYIKGKLYYQLTKKYIYILYDLLSIIVILLSFDKAYRFRSLKLVQPTQIARLIERFPKALKSIKRF